MSFKLFAEKDTVVGPYTRCVFCDGDGGGKPLTDEHAIPVAIGGRLVLEHATCARCQDRIGRFENKCLNGMLAPIRHYYDFATARARMDRPRLPVDVHNHEKGRHRVRVERGKHPTVWALPEFYSATEMTGQKHMDTLPCRRRITYFTQETIQNAQDLLKGHRADAIRVRTKNDDVAFAQMLGKMAHCYCIAALGTDGFTPIMNEAILNTSGKTISRFIGSVGRLGPTPPAPPSLHHEFTILTNAFGPDPSKLLLLLHMDLFVGFPETPRYAACVGYVNALTLQRIEGAKRAARGL